MSTSSDLERFIAVAKPGSSFNLYVEEGAVWPTGIPRPEELEVVPGLNVVRFGRGSDAGFRLSFAVPAEGERTETVYDARQGEANEQVSRFRPRYRKLTGDELSLHDEIKTTATALEALYDRIGAPGRYKALAITALEESVMWGVKELTK